MINQWNDWRNWLRRLGSADLFRRTHWRLTALYSGIFTLFLALFIVIAAALFYWITTSDQERRIVRLAEQEANTMEQFLLKQNDFDLFDDESLVLLSEDQLFFYVIGPNGDLLAGDEVHPRLRPYFLHALSRLNMNARAPVYLTVSLPEHMPGLARDAARDWRVLAAARPLVIHGNVVGILYIGMDVTSFFGVFHWLLIVLIGLAVLFLAVGVALSYFMSKRALVPIEEAYERQRQFVADASHELRTPLSVVFSSVEALTMEEDVMKNEFARRLLDRLREELKRITKLMNDLLTLARADAKHAALELAKQTFDFRPHAERTFQLVAELAAKKQLTMHFHAPEQAVVTADPDKLTQLLYILLDNAIKYTPEGGEVTLSIRTEPKQFILSVKDTGIGIPPEDISRIFDRFYRVDKARSRQQGGHGLGLSIAKWIIDAHGGTIHVDSQLGQGTEFIVRLPA
ncbi:cell wall metabolism sensor histidine kinase WalK [Geobacillus sp. C56-T2]|uniref:sensor histidine kinase n=1 Tax=Geobacillus sp. C56-T2 TaxID=600773 RepID=UPI00119D5CEF|nr:ATP-binding protein [Geobacillus sp. C56-T2]NNV07641.1 GHKL domain-containing protein [Geobacillus sp. MMMUD3]TWG29333.1 phospho-acceptor domain-containing protein [Geobacillus sp. C56-T2]